MDFLGIWGDVGFWLSAGAMIAVVAVLMLLALWRGRRQAASSSAYDLQIYRDQLREVERDLARGTITEEEARRVRTEVSRRVLEADRAQAAEAAPRAAPKAASWAAGIVVVAVLAGGSVLVYRSVGVPGMADDPMAARLAESRKLAVDRPSQATIETDVAKRMQLPKPDPQYAALVEKLREAVKKHPDDLTGQRLLAQHEAELGHFIAAYHAQEAVIRIEGDKVTAPEYSRLAQLMITATNGYVSPEAEGALNTALKMDPKDGRARFFLGLMMAQIGRPDIGFQIWQALLTDSKPDADWMPQLRAQLPQMAAMAGVRYELPPAPKADSALPGPSASQMTAAQNMTPAERKEMIRGMVEGLAERLDKSGGSAAEWARLIGAYGVLGESAKQQDALTKARAAYKDKPDALREINAAAERGAADQAGSASPALGPTNGPTAGPTNGPTAGDIAAAAKLSPAQRQQMIAGMIQQLNDKLATKGGTAPEWAQLIGAYGVLGNTQRATEIWNEAKTRFADHPDELAVIRAAAKKAGVAS